MDDRRDVDEPDSAETDIIVEDTVDYKKDKYVALFQARTILAKAGTMAERRVCNAQLKRMKKLGINY